MKVSNEKELGIALNENQETIEIEGDWTKKIIKIKAVGKVAWAIAIGAVSVAIITAMSGIGQPVSLVAGTGAVSILGYGAAAAAIAIAIGGGGVKVLVKLRKYKLIKQGNKIILNRN